jgi:hypothetical protein
MQKKINAASLSSNAMISTHLGHVMYVCMYIQASIRVYIKIGMDSTNPGDHRQTLRQKLDTAPIL